MEKVALIVSSGTHQSLEASSDTRPWTWAPQAPAPGEKHREVTWETKQVMGKPWEVIGKPTERPRPRYGLKSL